jgi:hypothetical protein
VNKQLRLHRSIAYREAGHMTEQAMTASPKLAVGWIFRGEDIYP